MTEAARLVRRTVAARRSLRRDLMDETSVRSYPPRRDGLVGPPDAEAWRPRGRMCPIGRHDITERTRRTGMAEGRAAAQGAQEHRVRDLHRHPVDPVDREPRAAVRGRRPEPDTVLQGHERAPQRDLPGRLHLPPVHGRVEVPLLLPPVRLGRPARQPAVRAGSRSCASSASCGSSGSCARTASRTSPAAWSRTEPAARSSPCSSWASWCSSSAASRCSTSSSTRPARTSRPAPTRCGTSSSPSRRWATATSIPVTNEGRLFGSLIIVIGVGIFGTFTGYLANLFLSPSKKPTAAEHHRRRSTCGPRSASSRSSWPSSKRAASRHG